MHNSAEPKDEPAPRRSSLFCNTVAYWREAKLGGFPAGHLVLFAVLMVALTAYSYFDSYLPLYVFVAAILSGEVAHILLCKRESPFDYFLEVTSRCAALGICWWVAFSYLGFPSFLGVLVIVIGPLAGAKAFVLVRKRLNRA